MTNLKDSQGYGIVPGVYVHATFEQRTLGVSPPPPFYGWVTRIIREAGPTVVEVREKKSGGFRYVYPHQLETADAAPLTVARKIGQDKTIATLPRGKRKGNL